MRINRVDAELYEAVEKKGDYTNRPNYQKPRNKAIKWLQAEHLDFLHSV